MMGKKGWEMKGKMGNYGKMKRKRENGERSG